MLKPHRNKTLLFPRMVGNEGALQSYGKSLFSYIDEIREQIDRHILYHYQPRNFEQVHDGVFNDLVVRFEILKKRFFNNSSKIEKQTKEFAQYNFDYVFKKKNHFTATNEIPRLIFNPSPRSFEILTNTIHENVQLIKTIPEQYLDQVEKHVLQAAAKGWDLHQLTNVLEERYEITRRRAANIAVSQQRLAINALDRQTSQDVGLFKCQWCHTPGLRYPRRSHEEASILKMIYDSRLGCFIDGIYIQAGQLYGCQCNGLTVLEW